MENVLNGYYWTIYASVYSWELVPMCNHWTYSKYVWDDYLAAKDDVYKVLSAFCETEITRLRGRDPTVFEIFLMSDLGEAHSKLVIRLCNKYGIVKQATAGYTPQHNAIVERWFWTNGEMSRGQLSQFNMGEEPWVDARRHGAWLTNRVPPTRVIQGEPWQSPRQRQYPDRWLTDLTKLKPFGTTCGTHVK